MAFEWVKKIFGKSKNNVGNMGPIESVYSNPYYEDNDNFAENPLFQEPDNFVPSPVEEKKESVINVAQKAKAASEPSGIGANFLENIGGMPTRASIDRMAGGLKMEKIGKHKNVAKALDALERYQQIMEQSHTITINEAAMNHAARWSEANLDTDGIREESKAALQAMSEFIKNADSVVKNANGLFMSRSSNVQKLAPVFSNLLVQAYGILPKLLHIDHAAGPYLIATDKETFTFSEVLKHQVSEGKTGGLAIKGAAESSGEVSMNPQEVLAAIKDEDISGRLEAMLQEKTSQARMNLKIPPIPVGLLKAERIECADEEQLKELKNRAMKIAESYISELNLLMTAVEDTEEAYDSGEKNNERAHVQEKQAEFFRMSRLLYRVSQSKDLIANVILRGISEEQDSQSSGYQDLMKLKGLSGMTLMSASGLLNQEAMDSSTFARLVDQEGNELKEGTDYIVGGGMASISILDFINNRVLRAEKYGNEFLTEHQQKTTLSGIRDEAVGKISQFLGLNVSAQAEAVGFKGKEKGKTEEQAVFGGSIMEMAKGTTAGKINLMMEDGLEDRLRDSRKGEGYHNLNVMKQGRLIGDIMKMNVLDYIVLHRDRNPGNFLIDLDANKNESMVTAIDNDKVLGEKNDVGRSAGGNASIEALIGINNHAFMDFGFKLETAFPMMTQEVKDIINNIDLGELNKILMPYADRVSRMAAVHRAGELKTWASKVPTFDLNTEKGTKEFVDLSNRASMKEWVRTMGLKEDGYLQTTGVKHMPGTLTRMILDAQFEDMSWGSAKGTIRAMKILGLSKEEIKEILMENLSSEEKAYTKITEERFQKSQFAAALEEYFPKSELVDAL